MHELFTKVLAKRDLSRAGDLFSVTDAEIVADLTEVVSVWETCGLADWLIHPALVDLTRQRQLQIGGGTLTRRLFLNR